MYKNIHPYMIHTNRVGFNEGAFNGDRVDALGCSVNLVGYSVNIVSTGNNVMEIESTLIINSVYTQYNGYCIDNELLKISYVKPSQTYGFSLIIISNTDKVSSYQSSPIYLKIRPLPTVGNCEVSTVNNTLLGSFKIKCNNNNNTSNILRYNIMSNNILWSNKFIEDTNTLTGTINVGKRTYIILARDNYGSTNCQELNYIWPDLIDSLQDIDGNVSQIIDNKLSETLSDVTNNTEAIATTMDVIAALYAINETKKEEASQFVDDIVFNVGNALNSKTIDTDINDTIALDTERNELINQISLTKHSTNTDSIVSYNTSKLILNNTIDTIFSQMKTLYSVYSNVINDTTEVDIVFRSELIVKTTLDTMINADVALTQQNDTIEDNELQEHTSKLFTQAGSMSLKGKIAGEVFDYEQQIPLNNGNGYNITISSKKISKTSGQNCTINNNIESQAYSLTFPDNFFEKNSNDLYDCSIAQTTKNDYIDTLNKSRTVYNESNIVIASIYNDKDNSELKYTSSYENPYLIKINMDANILETDITSIIANDFNNLNDFSDITNGIYYPFCTFWDVNLQTFSNEGCYIKNYTNNGIECACNHLTTFKGILSDFVPKVNKIDKLLLQQLSMKNIIKYPTTWITLLTIGVILSLICYCNPKSQSNKDGSSKDVPSLAYNDIVSKQRKNERLQHEQTGHEIDLLNKYMPNKDKLGNGFIPLIKSNDKTAVDHDIDRRPVSILCYLQFQLYKLYLKNDHTLLAMFQRTDGTNFTTRQRIACWFMYLCTMIMGNAIIYAQEQPTFGGITASFITSLVSTLPVSICRVLFKSSKPYIYHRENLSRTNDATDGNDLEMVPIHSSEAHKNIMDILKEKKTKYNSKGN